MSQFPLAKAARLVGVSRATIYRLVSEGKLSVGETSRGMKVVDAAELLRVFPSARLETGDRLETVSERKPETAPDRDYEGELRVVREMLDQTKQTLDVERAEKARLLSLVESQTRLLEDKSKRGGEFNPTQYLTGGLLVILVAVVAILVVSRVLR